MRVVVRGRLDAPISDSYLADVMRCYFDLLARSGLIRFRPYATLVNIFVIGAFGVAIPWRRAFDFFDPLLIILYSFIALLFSAPAVTDLLGTEMSGPRRVRRIMARIGSSALFGWGVFVMIMVLGILTVNVEFHGRHFLFPRTEVLGAALALSFAASLCVASLGALFSVVLTPISAKLILRGGFVGLLLFLLFGVRFLPMEWRAQMAANLTPRTLVTTAYAMAAVLILLAAGPILALRQMRD